MRRNEKKEKNVHQIFALSVARVHVKKSRQTEFKLIFSTTDKLNNPAIYTGFHSPNNYNHQVLYKISLLLLYYLRMSTNVIDTLSPTHQPMHTDTHTHLRIHSCPFLPLYQKQIFYFHIFNSISIFFFSFLPLTFYLHVLIIVYPTVSLYRCL